MKKLLLLPVIAVASFLVAGCHTTSHATICAETKSAGTVIQFSRHYTVVNGVPKVAACRQSGGATGVPLCYTVNYETHHVSGKTFASCATLFPLEGEEVEQHA